ncbi:MAG: hypothetical protein MUO37_05160 [Methyloceanibacter sp.]|nr:hypothetical protein [Methyloceanibacter sp.]
MEYNEDGDEIVAAAPAMKTPLGFQTEALQVVRFCGGAYAVQTVNRMGKRRTAAWVSPAALDIMVEDLRRHRATINHPSIDGS